MEPRLGAAACAEVRQASATIAAPATERFAKRTAVDMQDLFGPNGPARVQVSALPNAFVALRAARNQEGAPSVHGRRIGIGRDKRHARSAFAPTGRGRMFQRSM